MRKFNALDWTAFVLVVIGGLNWGLVGLFGLDMVETLFDDMTAVARLIYVVIGLASVYLLWLPSTATIDTRK